MKTKLYILIGISGSGKSTIANTLHKEHNNSIVVSTDGIRQELFNKEEEQRYNNQVFALAYKRIKENILQDKTVIFDATNLTHHDRCKLKNYLGDIWNSIYTIGVLVDTDLNQALVRNSSRHRVVPVKVVQRQYKQLQQDKEKIKLLYNELILK